MKLLRSSRLADMGGYTVVELIVVVALTLVVFAIPLTFVIFAINQQDAASARSVAATQEEVAMARLTRDLRQVVPGTTTTFTWGATSASVSLIAPVSGSAGASTQTVTWSCSFNPVGSCTRSAGGGTAASEMTSVTGVSFSAIDGSGNSLGGGSTPFSAANPAYVKITFAVQDTSQRPNATRAVSGVGQPIVLQDGVDLRNNSL